MNSIKQLPTHRYATRMSAVATIVLLLASCASMAPPYEAPALPVTPTYASDAIKDGTSTAAISWRNYFTDPQLQSLIKLALDNNRDLRIAALRVEEARATYGIQRAERFPTIGAQSGVDRSRTPADLNPTGKILIASQYQVGLGL